MSGSIKRILRYFSALIGFVVPLMVTMPLVSRDQEEQIVIENAILKTIDATRLAAEVAGKLAELEVAPGDKVTQGQKLGKIRDSSIVLQLDKSKISMAVARKKERSDIDVRLAELRAQVARAEYLRAEDSNSRLPGTYSTKEIERLRLVASTADLEIEKASQEKEVAGLDVMLAENDFKQVQDLLDRHQVIAPADGLVVSVEHRVGEWVEPGSELLQIVQINRLRIEGFIQQTDLGQQLIGRRANVEVVVGKEDLKKVAGKVVFVSPDANPINGRIRVHLEIENQAEEFRPGMRVLANIDLR